MSQVASTPEAVAALYARITQNLKAVRATLRRPLTLSEKVLLGHLDDPAATDLTPGRSYLMLRPDRVIFQDVLGQTGMLQFMQTRRERVAVPTTIHCDHLIQARVDGRTDLKVSMAENMEVYDFLRSAAARYGAGFWGPGAGIMHQVVLENYAFPGALIIGTDSHTPNAGGLGACAVGVGGADAVEVIAGLPWEVLYPRRIAVHLTGKLAGWTAPKDIILYVAGQLSVSGGTNAVIEYIGPGARSLSATGKATIANMGAELGATSTMFPADEHMLTYLEASGRGALAPLVRDFADVLAPDPEVEAHPELFYDKVLRLDLSTLEPHLVGPNSPDRARPISQMAAELRAAGNTIPASISAALIGSCTNSSYEDMSRAADVAQQAAARGVRAAVPFLVTPGSEQVRATIARDGQLETLTAMGGQVLANACGPCIGQWHRDSSANDHPNTIVTSFNRNFPRRNDGAADTMNLIGSPEIVTALALAGRLDFNPLTDTLQDADGKPFKLAPPARAPEVPAKNFTAGSSTYIDPPADGSKVEVNIAPGSIRLQRMEPWPAWDGRDFTAMPVLIKTRGKTTTDHISPAGPWLRFRGHLDRFSDNVFSGAVNAYTGRAGRVRNQVADAGEQTPAEVARDYHKRGLRWVAVGDANYGEGSSREHAALSPRLLGCAAVIAKSFARIHESNLKKQGLLALTFSDPADYDRVREGDRIDLVGLAHLAPGKPVECLLHHADTGLEVLQLRHTYSQSQLQWFRLGSALNGFHPR